MNEPPLGALALAAAGTRALAAGTGASLTCVALAESTARCTRRRSSMPVDAVGAPRVRARRRRAVANVEEQVIDARPPIDPRERVLAGEVERQRRARGVARVRPVVDGADA